MPSKYVTDKEAFIDRAILDIEKAFGRLSNIYYDDLEQFLIMLTKQGKLTKETKIRDIVIEIRKRFDRVMSDKVFKKELSGWFQSFEEIEYYNSKIQKDLNNIKVRIKDLPKTRQLQIDLVSENMIGSGVDANFLRPIREVIAKNTLAQSSFAETRDFLKNYILGDKDAQGKLQRYAHQIARDSIMQYDGTVNAQIMKTYEMTNISYVGSLIEDSRPQCIRWVEDFDGIIPVDELEDEIVWAEKNGSGMIDGTTVENFCVNRGGYNCRHQAIPTF